MRIVLAALVSICLLAPWAIAGPIPAPLIQGFTGVMEPGVSFPVFPALQDCSGDPCAASVSHGVVLNAFENGTGTASLNFDRAFFQAMVSDQGTGGFEGVASGTLYDNLTINAGSFLELPFHLTGSVTADLSIPTEFVSCVAMHTCLAKALPAAIIQFSLQCAAGPIGQATTNCTQTLNFETSQTVNTTIDLIIPFNAGQQFGLTLGPRANAELAGMFTEADNQTVLLQATGQAIGDFSHSLVAGPAIVLDSAMNPISNAIITADSGFNYLDPPGESASVPEPSALIPCAFLAFVMVRRGLRHWGPSTRDGWVDGTH